jgi:hypothetical protein
VGDVKEAKLCLSELREAPKSGDAKDLSGVVEAAMQEIFDAQVGVVEDGEAVQLRAAWLSCAAWLLLCALSQARRTGGVFKKKACDSTP